MNSPQVSEVSTLRLWLLRAMYLFIAAGLVLTVWPDIIAPSDTVASAKTVIRSLLGALALLCLLGLRYPLQMIPVLLFELLWKVIWIVLPSLCACGCIKGWISTPPRRSLPACWAWSLFPSPCLGGTSSGITPRPGASLGVALLNLSPDQVPKRTADGPSGWFHG